MSVHALSKSVRRLLVIVALAAGASLLVGCSPSKDDTASAAGSGGGVVQSAAASPSPQVPQTQAPSEVPAQVEEPTGVPAQPEVPPEPTGPLEEAQLEALLAGEGELPPAARLVATLEQFLAADDLANLERLRAFVTDPARALDASHYQALGEALLSAGRAELAREVLIAGERKHLAEREVFSALIERSLEEDPRYLPPMRTLQPDVDLDAIKYLGGGSTIVLRFLKDKTTIAAFKPRQTRLQSDPRAEIAAWRLCPLVRCGFDVPYNEPVRLEWKAFDGLYARLSSEKQRAYRDANFSDLKATRDEAGVSWVEGTMKAWVPDFTEYPIEISQIWRPWMQQSNPLEPMMEGLAVDAIDPIRKLHPSGDRLVKELRRHMGSMPRRELARQLSNLIAYDFLINNWDRFSGAKEFWGVNCQFAHGRFVSIDNGASFSRTPNEKVERQLERVQRFSRQFVAAVRALDHDTTLARLFPDASDYERERFATFWSQRERLLAHIDALIAEHGEEAVLAFE